MPPTNGVGGNFDVLEVTRAITIPENSEDKTGRIRIVYDNAWAERFSPEANVREGVVYDFPIRINARNTDLKQTFSKPLVKRIGNQIVLDSIAGDYSVEVFNASGQRLYSERLSDAGFNINVPKGMVVVRIKDARENMFSYKF